MKLKTYIKNALILGGIAVTMVACDEDKLPDFVHSDNRQVKLENTGFTSTGEEAVVVLAANADWHVTQKDEWIHISKESGTRGRHNLFISADANNTSFSRTGFIEIDMAGKKEQFAITQDGYAYSLEVSKSDIFLGVDGKALYQGANKLTVVANAPWQIEIPADCQWLDVSPSSGDAGETEIIFSTENNTSGEHRKLELVIKEGDISESITFRQYGTEPSFDNMAVGFKYFADDMAWATGGNDQVGSINGSAGTTLAIYSDANAGIKAEFDKRYFDFNAKGASVYAADGYLKFGKSGNQNAFMIKEPLGVEEFNKANVAVSFRLAKNGTDKFTVSVAIQGPGKIEGAVNDEKTLSAACVPVDNSDKSQKWQWKEFTVNISDVTSDTKIIIGETQYIIDGFKTRSGYFRGFIDDITVTRTANN